MNGYFDDEGKIALCVAVKGILHALEDRQLMTLPLQIIVATESLWFESRYKHGDDFRNESELLDRGANFELPVVLRITGPNGKTYTEVFERDWFDGAASLVRK